MTAPDRITVTFDNWRNPNAGAAYKNDAGETAYIRADLVDPAAIREAALHVENAKRLRRYDWQEWTAQDVEDAEGIICAFLALIERGTDQ